MPRRVLEGQVVSNKAQKTLTVLVERKYRHPVYKKYIKRTDKYAAHYESGAFQIGDKVQIIECRPISKSKRWLVVGSEMPGMNKSAPVQPLAPAKKPAAKAKKPAAKTAAKAKKKG